MNKGEINMRKAASVSGPEVDICAMAELENLIKAHIALRLPLIINLNQYGNLIWTTVQGATDDE